MAERIPQSVTKRVSFEAYLSSDHVTPATGKTIAITISKNGAAFGNPSGGATNAVEIASGSYYVDLTTTDTGTAGPLIVFGSVATVDPVKVHFTVVDPHNAGYDGVPSVASGLAGAIPTTGTGANQISVSSGQVILQAGTGAGQLDFTSGVVKANLAQILGTALTETAGQIAAGFKQFFNIASPTSTMNLITAVTTTTTATTATNLTNAPTAGDFTAAMKTSLNAATPASVVGAVGSVTGNVGGNVVGSVASVTARVTANSDQWAGGAIPAPNVTGVPLIDLKYTLGTISPATAGSVRADAVTGAVGSVTGAVGSVTGNVGGNVTGSVGSVVGAVGSVTGAVGSVTGNVGGNVTGSVGSVVGAVGSVTGAVGSVTGNVGGNVVGSVASVTAAVTVGAYSAGEDPATLVLDVAASSHNIANSIGAKINAAGGSADPWSTTIPAAYGAGTAGYALGNLIPLLLKYDFTTITGEANNSPINAFRALRRVSINDSNGLVTVYKEDGTTPAYTQQATFDTNALPLNKID